MTENYKVGDVDFEKYKTIMDRAHLHHESGRVVRIIGYVIEAYIPGACIGSICEIFPMSGSKTVMAEAVGFKDKRVLLMPMGEVRGIKMGSEVQLKQMNVSVRISNEIVGRVVNSLCEPIDGKGDIAKTDDILLYRDSYDVIERSLIKDRVDLGVRSVNGFITAGVGQRLGIFAGAGCGKSVLLAMMARNTDADINVVALVGERTREVKNFIEKELGEEAMKKTILVVATSDDSPVLRVRAAYLATAIAEHFRDKGKKVLLTMDSITRFAMALREMGLAVGEPPATKGYPPSVFAEMPKLFERVSTTSGEGSITGLYTVLMETEEIEDPVAESVKSVIDGHIFLSKKLAERGHYPAVDILKSISRVMVDVVDQEHLDLAVKIRRLIALYRDVEDLINLGAYVPGSNPEIDLAIQLYPRIEEFLTQGIRESSNMEDTVKGMREIFVIRQEVDEDIEE